MLRDLSVSDVSRSVQLQTDWCQLLNTLGVAVVSAELSQMRLRISTAENSSILAIELARVR